jgi:hypothetical protein
MQEKTLFYDGYLEICRFFRIFAATNEDKIIKNGTKTQHKVNPQ